MQSNPQIQIDANDFTRVLQLLCLIAQSLSRIEAKLAQIAPIPQQQHGNGKLIPLDLNLLDADGKAEVDGVPVPVMDAWLLEAIETLQDEDSLEKLLAEERKEQKKLPAAIRKALRQAGIGSRKSQTR